VHRQSALQISVTNGYDASFKTPQNFEHSRFIAVPTDCRLLDHFGTADRLQSVTGSAETTAL
jgi:hypothetical protein